MTQLPAGALEDVASALVSELPAPDAETLIGIDGVAKAAQILNACGREASSTVLTELAATDPDLAEAGPLAMFTFEELVRLDPKSMRTLLRGMPTERLTVVAQERARARRERDLRRPLDPRLGAHPATISKTLGNVRRRRRSTRRASRWWSSRSGSSRRVLDSAKRW